MCLHLVSNQVLAADTQVPTLDTPLVVVQAEPKAENEPRYAPLPCIGTQTECAEISELAAVEKALGKGSLATEFNQYQSRGGSGTFADYIYKDVKSTKAGAVSLSIIGGLLIAAGSTSIIMTPFILEEEWFFASIGMVGAGIPMMIVGGMVRRRANRKLKALDEIRFRERHNLPTVKFMGVAPYATHEGGGIAAGIAY